MQTEDLRNSARHSYDRELTKQNLKVTMESRLNIEYNGGMFVVTTELMSFLNIWDRDLYLLDSYDVPVFVNPQELLKICKQRYYEVMNEWQIEYEKQSKIRTAKNF